MYPARELKAELPSPAGLDVLDSTSDDAGVCMSVSATINGSYLQWLAFHSWESWNSSGVSHPPFPHFPADRVKAAFFVSSKAHVVSC